MLNKLSDFGFKLGTILLAVLTAAIVVAALLGLCGIGFGYLLSIWVFDWVTTNLGLDYHAANFATAVIVFLVWAVAPSLMWKFWLRERRMWSGLAVVAFYGSIWLLVSTVGGNVCFDRQTGKPLCYFVDTPSGRKWSRTPGFDPSSGKQFQLYTREIKEREDRYKEAENQSGRETNRSRTEVVTPLSAPTVKTQPTPEMPGAKNQTREAQDRTATIDNSPKIQDRKTFQTAPNEIETPVAEEQKVETYSTIEPLREVKTNPNLNGETVIVQPRPISTRTTERETSDTESRAENTIPKPKQQEKKKEDPVKTALKTSAIDLLNVGLGRVKRKIQ
ncbi:MAG TPA: hypothetical protein VF692_11330 [Pyrinomonadaceae bacterium]